MKAFVPIVLLFLLGCGGGKKEAEAPETGGGETVEREKDVMIPQEQMDAVRRILTGRSSVVARCFVRGIEAGELESSARGYVSVGLTVTPAGKATSVEVLESDLSSRALHDCVIEYVGSWAYPEMAAPFRTSHIYRFQEL